MIHYSATIEWLGERVGVLRLHPSPRAALGDPYVWCCTIAEDFRTAVIKGVCSPVPPGAGRAIRAVLKAEGFERRRYERRGPDGSRRTIEKRN